MEQAKKNTNGIFKGVTPQDILKSPEDFVKFIQEKALLRFQPVLKKSIELGDSLATGLKKAANEPKV